MKIYKIAFLTIMLGSNAFATRHQLETTSFTKVYETIKPGHTLKSGSIAFLLEKLNSSDDINSIGFIISYLLLNKIEIELDQNDFMQLKIANQSDLSSEKSRMISSLINASKDSLSK